MEQFFSCRKANIYQISSVTCRSIWLLDQVDGYEDNIPSWWLGGRDLYSYLDHFVVKGKESLVCKLKKSLYGLK